MAARRGPSTFAVPALALAGALALGACAAPVAPGMTALAPPSAAETGSAAATPLPMAAALRPQLAVAQLASLKDLSQAEIVARLGTPDTTRRDPPAEIWQYRGAACVLDVFLYPEGGGLKVLYAGTRERARLSAPPNNCTPFAPERSAAN
jgi:hypothetical protein